MADTHSSARTAPGARGAVAHRSDKFAAFAGLVVGVVALFLLLGSIVMLTNRHYAAEKGAAAAGR